MRFRTRILSLNDYQYDLTYENKITQHSHGKMLGPIIFNGNLWNSEGMNNFWKGEYHHVSEILSENQMRAFAFKLLDFLLPAIQDKSRDGSEWMYTREID